MHPNFLDSTYEPYHDICLCLTDFTQYGKFCLKTKQNFVLLVTTCISDSVCFLKKLVSEYFLQCYLLNYKLYSNFSIFPLMSLLCQDPGCHVTLCHHVSFNSWPLIFSQSIPWFINVYTFGNTTKVMCHSWYVMSGA